MLASLAVLLYPLRTRSCTFAGASFCLCSSSSLFNISSFSSRVSYYSSTVSTRMKSRVVIKWSVFFSSFVNISDILTLPSICLTVTKSFAATAFHALHSRAFDCVEDLLLW